MISILPHLSLQSRRHVYAWLCLAVASLVGAGIFALLVALARTPGIADLLPGTDYFRVALVGHVILAMVVWFLVFQGVLWAFSENISKAGFWMATSGIGVLVLTSVLGLGEPILANYVPVLADPWFIGGLLLFSIGMGLTALKTVRTIGGQIRPFTVLDFGAFMTATLVLLSLLCFGLAAVQQFLTLDSRLTTDRFEALVWGGGHVLQFANTAAMVLVWFILMRLTLGIRVFEDRWAKRLLGLYLVFVLPAPFLYLSATSGSYFTLLMALGLGPLTLVIALAILWKLFRYSQIGLPWSDPGFAALVLSLLLFSLGALVSVKIQESNVIIPAHYHGVIGAVTLSFMGLSYSILSWLGKKVWSPRLARIQPYLYGIGQSLFVLGLLWAGMHGVARKTFGTAQELNDLAQWFGMGLMGFGGLVAILGGVAFIVNLGPSLICGIRPIRVRPLSGEGELRCQEWIADR